jgi:hypothetical protein
MRSKGISVKGRQASQMKCGLFIEIQTVDAMTPPLGGHEPLGCLRKEQSAGSLLQGDLPGGDDAQVHLVVRICACGSSGDPACGGEAWRAGGGGTRGGGAWGRAFMSLVLCQRHRRDEC